MTKLEDAAVAQVAAQRQCDAMSLAERRATAAGASIFSQAYAEAKRREAYAAVVSAAAQARWATWSFTPRIR